jgi:hypothetical protein
LALLQPSVMGCKTLLLLGHINMHFIKESWAVREGGGLGSFFHCFFQEAQLITRAHVAAMGGNALLGFRLMGMS